MDKTTVYPNETFLHQFTDAKGLKSLIAWAALKLDSGCLWQYRTAQLGSTLSCIIFGYSLIKCVSPHISVIPQWTFKLQSSARGEHAYIKCFFFQFRITAASQTIATKQLQSSHVLLDISSNSISRQVLWKRFLVPPDGSPARQGLPGQLMWNPFSPDVLV